MTKVNREAWLGLATKLYAAKLFKPQGLIVPDVRVSVGFPYGRRGGKGAKAIGQCWANEASADGVNEIFISPELVDAPRVSDVLIHELVHATVGIAAGHGSEFKKAAVSVGLTGPMTATEASPELTAKLDALLKELPAYPHQKLDPNANGRAGPKKQGTRMLKIVCPQCGWTARASAKWIDRGLPICACGGEIVAEDEDGDPDE